MSNHDIFSRARVMAGAALLALAAAPLHAQEAQTHDQQTEGQQAEGQDQAGQAQDQSGAQQADVIVATVGTTDLRASDVLAVIEAMPPNMRQQPREMLVPMAIEQAVLRELILQQAMSENLAEDPDVQTLVEGATRIAEEDAMVSVWLQREMEGRITDQRVQEVYDRLQSEAAGEFPPLESVRPQIEQHLGREAIEGVRSELRDNISVVYYGPDGQPLETSAEAEAGAAPEGQEEGTAEGSQGEGAGASESGEGQTGASDDTSTDAGD